MIYIEVWKQHDKVKDSIDNQRYLHLWKPPHVPFLAVCVSVHLLETTNIHLCADRSFLPARASHCGMPGEGFLPQSAMGVES